MTWCVPKIWLRSTFVMVLSSDFFHYFVHVYEWVAALAQVPCNAIFVDWIVYLLAHALNLSFVCNAICCRLRFWDTFHVTLEHVCSHYVSHKLLRKRIHFVCLNELYSSTRHGHGNILYNNQLTISHICLKLCTCTL